MKPDENYTETKEEEDLNRPDAKKRLNGKFNSKEAIDQWNTEFKKRCFKE